MRHHLTTFALAALCGLTARPAFAAGSGTVKPKEPSAKEFYEFGQRAERGGHFQKAAEAYELAVKAEPKFAEAHNQLGYVQRQLKLYDKAVASYTRALQLKPKFAEAHEYIARAYIEMGDLAKAREHHRTLVTLNKKLARDLGKAIVAAEAKASAAARAAAGA